MWTPVKSRRKTIWESEMSEKKQGVSRLTFILFVLVVIVVLGYLFVDFGGSGSGSESTSSAKRHQVVFTVDGVGTALLTYEDADGEMGQEKVTLPWAADHEAKGDRSVYISAIGSGRLECTILIDGKLLEEKTGSGEVKCEARTE
jgi:hypothetical protein